MQSLLKLPDQPHPIEVPFMRMTVSRYHEMIATGVFDENDAVELLDGYIVEKMPKDPKHSQVTRMIAHALRQLMREGRFVDTQEPITLATSEPEPDIFVVKGKMSDFFGRHPLPDEVELVIEVSNSTKQYDSTVKQEIYASAEIPQYWIVNLIENQVEVYTDPHGTTYRQKSTYTKDQTLPVVIATQKWGDLILTDLLP